MNTCYDRTWILVMVGKSTHTAHMFTNHTKENMLISLNIREVLKKPPRALLCVTWCDSGGYNTFLCHVLSNGLVIVPTFCRGGLCSIVLTFVRGMMLIVLTHMWEGSRVLLFGLNGIGVNGIFYFQWLHAYCVFEFQVKTYVWTNFRF